jgi:BirA family biotin operon repressor/biotin-[acetyl-CoA-carboxylase] ligase
MILSEPRLPPGYRLHRFDSVASTNDEARALARAGAAGRSVVWALEQRAGRGRRGRSWISPPGNLYLSLLLYPRCPAGRAAQLGFVAALALTEALPLPPATAISCKWPNDVLAGGRKIAGILLESEMGEGGRLAHLVLGVGVNVVSSPRDTEFPATSIAEEGGIALSPAALLTRFLGRFDAWMQRWQEEGFGPVRANWLPRAAFLGEPLRLRLADVSLDGRFLDLDEGGALLFECQGETRRISAGEVFPAAG